MRFFDTGVYGTYHFRIGGQTICSWFNPRPDEEVEEKVMLFYREQLIMHDRPWPPNPKAMATIFVDKLKTHCYTDSSQANHAAADCILTNFLRVLGYNSVVEEYEKIEKLYI